MTRLFIIISAAILSISSYHLCSAQSVNNNWADFQFLIGDWDGQGTGKPGTGTGGFSLQPDLDGKVLIRKNHAEYPATNDKPAFSHNDIMIISPEDKTGNYNAVYYDNEGHVINYKVTFNDSLKALVFISNIQTGLPRFRLIYSMAADAKLNIQFDIAPPGKPDSFSTYISASAIRKK